MGRGVVETSADANAPDDRRVYGMTAGRVVSCCDQTRVGRVQVHLPWLPSYEPWARVVTPMAGKNQGFYFMPQVGDEVLVGFHDGDITDAYVLGSVWNARDTSPAESATTDPVSKRVIRTPQGHEIAFDEDARSITITTADKQRVLLTEKKIEIAMDEEKKTAITMSGSEITISASSTITLDAPTINVKGRDNATLGDASSTVTITGKSIDIG